MSDPRRLEKLRAVAVQADALYNRAESLGAKAAKALSGKKRSQITGLESIANCALKTTDVFDFVKLRSARQKEWRSEGLGQELLEFLNDGLRPAKQRICRNLDIDAGSAEGLEVHLMLIREFVRQLAAHYEYACQFPGGKR